ncbi:MAG: T9SS type A sorting domain-containing protein [Bacteroidota bacterium]
MLKQIYTISFLLIFSGLQSQITISESDMPDSGDTIRISQGIIPMSVSTFHTATDTTWDFSQLTAGNQKVVEFEDISQLPLTYQSVFNNPLNPEKQADYGIKEGDSISFSNITFTDPYTFLQKTNNHYGKIGYGVTFNGVAIPGDYDSLEVLYEFPLSYGDTSSSHSVSNQDMPSIGFVEREVYRENKVDGWGKLITPYGQFDVIRVRSEVTQRDSINLDSFPSFPAITSQRTELKWIGKNQGIPLLKITLQNGIAIEAEYIDSVRNINTAVTEVEEKSSSVYPNPVTTNAVINWQADFEKLKVYNVMGQLIFQSGVKNRTQFTINESIWPESGLYLIELSGEDVISRQKVIKR